MIGRLRSCLTGLLAGLFVLAILPAPAQHTRALIERAAFALSYALPDGTLPALCSEHGAPSDGHNRHVFAPACFACIIMSAPGLPAPVTNLIRIGGGVALAEYHVRDISAGCQIALASHRARAPPAASIA